MHITTIPHARVSFVKPYKNPHSVKLPNVGNYKRNNAPSPEKYIAERCVKHKGTKDNITRTRWHKKMKDLQELRMKI